MAGRKKEFSFHHGESRKKKCLPLFETQTFTPGLRTFASTPLDSLKNPVLPAEHLKPLEGIQFFRQNTTIIGQKPGATDVTPSIFLVNQVFSAKFSCFWQNSRAIAKNLVDSIPHREDFLKIPWILLRTAWIWLKSRGINKNLVDFIPDLVDFLKIPWILLRTAWIWLKSRGISKNPVDFIPHLVDFLKIPWILLRTSWIWLKSRGINKNPVDFIPHLVDFLKIPWILLRTAWIRLKSRGINKNPVDFIPHLVDFLKIPWILLLTAWISQKSRGSQKNPVDLKKISWISQKSRGFRSLPGFIDISGHNHLHADYIFNTDALLQGTFPFKTSFPLLGICKSNLNLKINIRTE